MAGKMVKGLGGNSSSQSVRDRLNAAKHSISGSGLAKSICKATTDQVISPKPKHLTYLTLCTNEPNVSIPEMADKLLQRTQDASWVVVFKALITVHNLMNQGNERFTQYVASNNRTVNLQSFSDKSGVQGYDMSLFIRRYARYINQKAISYRTMAFDFCRVKRGKTDGVLRTMNTEKLLKALPVIQEQVDALVEFDATSNELCNNVINAAFILLFNDLIRLFACYNDGVINLLEQYFDMNKKQCREALDIYKKFVLRMEKVSAFLRVAERFGIDKGDIPDLAKAPSSLLEALEQHLASLEGRKIPTSTSSPATNSGSGGNRSGGDKAVNGSPSAAGFTFTQAERHKIIEEEKQRLAAFKEQRQLSLEKMAVTVNQSPSSPLNTLSEEGHSTSAPMQAHVPSVFSNNTTTSNVRPSDDLFGMFDNQPNAPPSIQAAPAPPAVPTASPWPATTSQPSFSGREVNFEAAFGQQSQSSASAGAMVNGKDRTDGNYGKFGHILQPQTSISNASSQPPTNVTDAVQGGPSVITADIDTSLASLAGNLNISSSDNMKKQDHKWINPSVTMQQKTGGTTFAGPTIASGPTINWNAPVPGPTQNISMNSPPAIYNTGAFPNYSTNMVPVVAPAWQPQPGMMYGQPGVMPQPNPGYAPVAYMPTQGMPVMHQPMQPPMGFVGNPQTMQTAQSPAFQPMQQRPQAPPTDPFGL